MVAKTAMDAAGGHPELSTICGGTVKRRDTDMGLLLLVQVAALATGTLRLILAARYLEMAMT